MQEMLRLFIAVELNSEIHENLGKLIDQLKTISSRNIKWVKPEIIHLTLKFLGDTPQKELRTIIDLLAEATLDKRPFEIEVKGSGCFPSVKQPRVIWAGVESPGELGALQKTVDQSLTRLKIPTETRPFVPHLTLARVNEGCDPAILQRITQELQNHRGDLFGKMEVTRFTLFQSTLTREGPIYAPKAYIPLHK